MPRILKIVIPLALLSLIAVPAAAQPLLPVYEIVPPLPVSDGAYYGQALEVEGDMLFVGATYAEVGGQPFVGLVDVYRKTVSPAGWEHIQRIDAPGAVTYGFFGSSVAIDGDIAIIAANGSGQNPSVATVLYVYRWNGTLWVFDTSLANPLGPPSPSNQSQIGSRLEFDGHHLIASGGPVVAYTLTDGVWSTGVEVPQFVLPGCNCVTYGGWEIDLTGDRLLIGNPYFSEDSDIFYDGILTEYHFIAGSWVQTEPVYQHPVPDVVGFGSPETCDDGTVLIGAFSYEEGTGRIYVYESDSDGSGLIYTGVTIENPATGLSRFGESVTCRDGMMVTGSSEGNVGDITGAGRVEVFTQTGSQWAHTGTVVSGEPVEFSSLGYTDIEVEDGIVYAAEVAGAGQGTAPGRVWTTYGSEPPPPVPQISVSAESATEGDGTLTITVSQDIVSASDVTFTLTVFSANTDSATASADYTAFTAGGIISAGSQSTTFPVTLIDDSLDEPDETFTAALSAPTNATILAGTATATIVDDDAPPPVPQISVSAESATEGDGTLTITVSQDIVSASDVTFTLTVFSANTDSATASADYTAFTTGGTISAGSQSTTFPVTLANDSLDEPDETFTAALSAPTNATILAGTATATILDNDEPPVIPPVETILIANSGFEGAVRGALSPWTVTGATNDKIKCNKTDPPKTFSYAGACAFQITGGARPVTLKQKVAAANFPVVMVSGGTFGFSLMYSAEHSASKLRAQVKLFLADGSSIVLKATGFVRTPPGGIHYLEAGAPNVPLTALSAAAPVKLVVTLMFSGKTGKVYVDEVAPVYIAP